MTPISSSAASSPSPSFEFSVVDRDCKDFPLVVQAFRERVAPIYGPQETALDKIGRGSDRLCEMLYENGIGKAIIVYKKAVNQRGALELKTLAVLNPETDSDKGYEDILVQRVVKVAKMRMADYIEVTVSSKKPETLAFFTKNKFTVHNSSLGYYEKGATEHFLYKDLRVAPVAAAAAASTAPTESRLFQCTLGKQYIQQIRSGAKTYEGRIYSGPFRNYRIGDRVTWFAGQDSVTTEITDLKVYKTFEEMLKAVGFKKMLPLVAEFELAAAAYHNIPSYTDRARQSGVVALGVKVIADPVIDSGPSAGSKRGRT
jgi:ASC-1-like (ASCH) protein/ribosomal protein S18 acetylase RimI-like enzyme